MHITKPQHQTPSVMNCPMLQIVTGCTHNKCHFCSIFRDVEFQMSPIEEIEQDLQNSMDREISTADIGERVMEKLRYVDQVAYVRFASVYRQFKDIDTFMAELNKLLADGK